MSLVRRIVLAAALAFAFAAPALAEPAVGFQRLTIPDAAGPPVDVAVWYPTRAKPSPQRLALFTQTVATDAPVAGTRRPLVVISHGNGGELSGHYDTAQALAKAGFVVAALTHTGDNARDQSRAADMANRPRQLSLLIDYMTRDWPPHAVDPRRVGAFGFSSGGFTVLAAAGGRPDLSRVGPHCQEHPAFFDCALVKQHPEVLAHVPAWPSLMDRRIKAIVSAAPALGYTFGKEGLRDSPFPCSCGGPRMTRSCLTPSMRTRCGVTCQARRRCTSSLEPVTSISWRPAPTPWPRPFR